MMNKILIAAFLCLLAFPVYAEGRPGVSPVMSSTTGGAPGKRIGVFFVGNSYTYSNEMPQMLADIASSDPGSNILLEIQSGTKQSGTLDTLWKDESIRAAFTARPWTYIVLQEQSLWAMLPEHIEATALAARKWNSFITEKSEAQLVIFATWMRQPNSFWYTERKYSFLGSPRNMQQKLSENSAVLAMSLRGLVAPVGDAWAAALKDDPKWPLYGADSHHPTAVGSYLTALVFYQLFTGRSAEDTSFVPKGVNAESAQRLRKIAASMRQGK